MAKKTAAAVTVSLRYCAARFPKPQPMARDVTPGRLRLILQTKDKWLNGSKLRYWFFDTPKKWVGPKDQQDVVRKAFALWKALGVGLDFAEVKTRNDADVRIAFLQGDGSWSYIGTDVRTKRTDLRTMNFGWSLTQPPAEGLDTALHEIGHTLGLPHEHQNPFAGIVWNEAAVYAALAKPPNSWPRSTTFHNIIEKIVADEVQGSTWDSDSVMHYPFEAGLIDKPTQFRAGITPAGALSARDREWILKFYPQLAPETFPTLLPLQSVPLTLAPAQQANFVFTPTQSRDWEFRTFGPSDTVMALFEGTGASGKAIAEDDDSGEGRNSYFKLKLTAGRTYLVRVRLYYTAAQGQTGIMAW